MLKIRRPLGRLIFNMGIAIPGKTVFLIETAPWPRRIYTFHGLNVRQRCIINTLRPRQNGRHFTDDILKYIFLNEIVWIPTEISLKSVPKDPINNIPALVYIMAWRRPGDKPLYEAMMVTLPTHICVARPQWVKVVTNKNPHCRWYFSRDVKALI